MHKPLTLVRLKSFYKEMTKKLGMKVVKNKLSNEVLGFLNK